MKEAKRLGRLYAKAIDAIPREELDRRWRSGEGLRVKLGLEPTAPDIHLGHAGVLKKLLEIQDRGHTAGIVVGD